MEREAAEVKRRYDGSRRRAQAEITRAAIVAAARDLLLTEGYAAATVPRVARACGVSVESVYKRFGGKPGLVHAVVETSLHGVGPIPAEARSDALPDSDAYELVRGWGRLTTEVAPRVAPVLLLVRAAAAQDAELASLAAELERSRRARMAANARRLDGHLRPGVSLDEAADVLFTYSSPELYDLLVLRSSWDLPRYGAFISDGLVAQLLEPVPGPSLADSRRRRRRAGH